MKRLQRIIAPIVLLAASFTLATPAQATIPSKGTEILWDRYGIPHIFAPDRASLFDPYGYSQMERIPNFWSAFTPRLALRRWTLR